MPHAMYRLVGMRSTLCLCYAAFVCVLVRLYWARVACECECTLTNARSRSLLRFVYVLGVFALTVVCS